MHLLIDDLIAKNIIKPVDNSTNLEEIIYPKSHASKIQSSHYLKDFSDTEIKEMKLKLARI